MASKGLDALKDIKNNTDACFVYDHLEDKDNALKIIEKELKALEIIKPLVELTKETNYWWLWLGMNGVQITQEQYDLLKEWLDNE